MVCASKSSETSKEEKYGFVDDPRHDYLLSDVNEKAKRRNGPKITQRRRTGQGTEKMNRD